MAIYYTLRAQLCPVAIALHPFSKKVVEHRSWDRRLVSLVRTVMARVRRGIFRYKLL